MDGTRKTRTRGELACLPRALRCFIAPMFHAIQSNDLFIIDHFKGYAFPVLKAIKYSCNISFTFSVLQVANSQIHFQSLNCKICKSTSRWFHLVTNILACDRAAKFSGAEMKIYERSLQAHPFFPAPCTRVSFRVLLSRDISRLPQIMESLLARYQHMGLELIISKWS